MKRIISLQKIGEIDKIILLKLKKNLEWVLKDYIEGVEIMKDEIPLAEENYDSARRQYNASLVIKDLIDYIGKRRYFRILGIMDKDIFSTPLNFVFGIAFMPKGLNPRVALISTTRLDEKFYRREDDQAIFELRVLKEAIHELGHTFGLEHCDEGCIMRFSNTLQHTDEKPPKFCERCEKKLNMFFSELK